MATDAEGKGVIAEGMGVAAQAGEDTAVRYTLSQIQKQPSQISWILHCGVGDPAKGTRVQVDDYRSVEAADSQAMPQ